MRKRYYDDAKENAAFERCVDVVTSLILKYGPALKRIDELEKENAKLREELEYYRNRKLSGWQKHNAKWMEEFYGRR